MFPNELASTDQASSDGGGKVYDAHPRRKRCKILFLAFPPHLTASSLNHSEISRDERKEYCYHLSLK